jgi:small subunit ribosomal protein S4
VNTPRPKVRKSRALGIPLTPKCVRYFERRPYSPGEHGRKRKTPSDYAVRLREKQRLRAQYDISETQLRRAFDRAKSTSGKTARR